MPFAPEVQTKQFVAEVNGAFGFRFRVFTTASDQHYLFVCVQNPDFQFPVAKSHLKPEVRAALANGVGHAPLTEEQKRAARQDERVIRLERF